MEFYELSLLDEATELGTRHCIRQAHVARNEIEGDLMSDQEEVEYFWILTAAKQRYEERRRALADKGFIYSGTGVEDRTLALGLQRTRPHCSLSYRTSAEFAPEMSHGKDVGSTHPENATDVFHSFGGCRLSCKITDRKKRSAHRECAQE